jgi:hypothetical protein
VDGLEQAQAAKALERQGALDIGRHGIRAERRDKHNAGSRSLRSYRLVQSLATGGMGD